jgi:hypothetical protein
MTAEQGSDLAQEQMKSNETQMDHREESRVTGRADKGFDLHGLKPDHLGNAPHGSRPVESIVDGEAIADDIVRGSS